MEDTGKVADYIPQLAKVDPTKFAVAVTTIDGQRFSFGDADELFCLQSSSKPITYAMALKEHGMEVVHEHVGREPSGRVRKTSATVLFAYLYLMYVSNRMLD